MEPPLLLLLLLLLLLRLMLLLFLLLLLQAVSVSGLEEAFRRLPGGGSYRGIPLGGSNMKGETAAALLHKDIACALQQHEDFKPVFSGQGGQS